MKSIVNKPMMIVLILFLSMSLTAVAIISNPLQRGLIAYYYDNPDWAGSPVLTVRERSIDLYSMKVEFPSITTHYSIQWKGVIFIPISGKYQFSAIADDSAEIFINDQSVVGRSGQEGSVDRADTVHLEKGFHSIRIRYMQEDGAAKLEVYWEQPGQEREMLARASLFSEKPAETEFLIGRLLEKLLLVCKFLSLISVMSGFVMIISNRHILVAFANHCIIIALIFFIVFIGHFWGSRNSTSFDSMWSIPAALSIIREKNVDLDEYRRIIEKEEYYAVEIVGNHLYPVYPTGTPIIAIPFVYVLDRFLDRGLSIDLGKVLRDNYGTRGGIEVCIASVLIALTSIFIYLIGCLCFNDQKYSILITFIFAFCTSAWSTASRALWQHTSSIFLLAVSLYLIVLAKENPKYEPLMIRLVGILLAFSYVVRPTNSISILLFTTYILIRHRKHFLPYCLWSLIVVIPFLLFNFSVYHSPLSTYYLPQHQFNANLHFGEALAGNLFSPSRGLFIFSPVLLFSIYGILMKVRNRQMEILDYFILAIMLLHWVTISTFPTWWAGHSYGPRYFSDIIPYFIYFLIPVVSKIPTLTGIRKAGVTFLLFCSVLISFFIHFRGATDWEVYAWNSDPVNVDVESSRVWDWRDIQFLRGIK